MTHSKSRRLYLVRHGEAKPKDEDPERGLTEEGHSNVRKMASWFGASGIRVDEIRHSGKLRAQQTAEIFAEALGTQVEAVSGLAPKDDVTSIVTRLESGAGNIMLVGHLPFLERLAALLTAGNADSSNVTLDAGAVLELTMSDDAWRVTCLMQPRLLPST